MLGLSTGIGLIRGNTTLAHLGTGVNLDASAWLARNYGIGIVAVSAVLLLGALLVSLPSQIIRSWLALLEIVALGVTLAAHFGGGSLVGLVTVLGLGASGTAIVDIPVVIAIQSVIIYALAIHPPTYRAFHRRPRWVSYASR